MTADLRGTGTPFAGRPMGRHDALVGFCRYITIRPPSTAFLTTHPSR